MLFPLPNASLVARIEVLEEELDLALASPAECPDHSTWARRLGEARALCAGDDDSLTVVIDDLQALAHVGWSDDVPAPSPMTGAAVDPRFGFGVMTEATREALVPSIAALLLHGAGKQPRELAAALPELSIADHALWLHLSRCEGPGDVRDLARRWLGSPARRVAWDLGSIDRVGSPGGLTVERVLAAAGAPDDARADVDPTSWPPVHACTPLQPISLDGRDATVVRALRALAAPEWLWARSQAMSALLERAATAPSYTVGGLHADLREELPARFGAVFEVPDDDALQEFERELLRAAVALAPAITSGAVAFAVARWLGYVLVRSPFHASDPRVLAARLSGVRRGEAALTPCVDDDVLHPRRLLKMLGDRREGWRDLVSVAGAAGHYLADGEQQRLAPVPVTLVDRLRQIAARKLTPGEHEQEVASAGNEGSSALRRHVAPPWIARATLHRTRSPWLSQLDQESFLEALGYLDSQPSRYAWLTESIALAARYLGPEIRVDLAAWWRRTEPSDSLRAHQLALVASAAPAEIGTDGLPRLGAQVMRADPEWRPFLANALAVEARHAGAVGVERYFLGALEGMIENPSLPEEQRQRALAWWAQRIQADRALLTPEVTSRLRTLMSDPMVSSNPRLRLVLAQLGVDARSRVSGTRR